MHKLSELDRSLLALLRDNARESITTLASKLDVSRATIQSRMDRLCSVGVVRGYTVKLATDYERSLVRAHIAITVAPKNGKRVEKAIRDLREVEALYCVSGVYDFIAVVAAESVGQLDRVIDSIGELDDVERTTTSIILSTKFER